MEELDSWGLEDRSLAREAVGHLQILSRCVSGKALVERMPAHEIGAKERPPGANRWDGHLLAWVRDELEPRRARIDDHYALGALILIDEGADDGLQALWPVLGGNHS